MRGLRAIPPLLVSLVLTLATLSCQASEHPIRPAEIGMTLHLRGADAATVKREFDLMSAMNVELGPDGRRLVGDRNCARYSWIGLNPTRSSVQLPSTG